MRTLLVAMLAALFSMSAVSAAQAQSVAGHKKKTPVVNHRQRAQQRRIVRGVKRGTLTKGEARKLERQQRRIARTKRRDKAMHGGKLTRKEKKHITRMQNRASRRVHRMKHNKKVRH